MQQLQRTVLWSFLIAGVLASANALAQPDDARDERTISGRVISSTRNTLTIRTGSGRYQLFVYDRDTTKPGVIAAGATVNVVSTPGDEQGVRVARSVVVSSSPSSTQQRPAMGGEEPIPPYIRQLERDIERQVRRYGLGLRVGAALDPELALAGVQARLGPFFNRDISFRPNLEFGFGEVTTLIAFNFEAVYRLPISPRQGRWSAYVGAGPGFNFIDQNFERAQTGDRDIDFSDLDFDTGLNLLTGVEFRSGMFIEFKSSAYAIPSVRVIMGFNF